MITKGKLNVTLPSDTEILVTRSFDAPRALVFETMTECKHMQKWMLGPEGWTMPICEMELRPGASFRWGWQKDGGETMEITGDIKEVSPPERLVTTERWGGEWPEAVNVLTLKEVGGRTEMEILIQYPSKAARDSALETGMADGMEISYERLDAMLPGLK